MLRKRKTGDICCNYALALYNFEVYLNLQKFHVIFDSGLELSTWGRVTHFVSWCWSYRLKDFVSAVNGWVRKSGVDGEDVFLWICFFCNNQYRILQEAANARCGCKNVQTRSKVCCEHYTLPLLITCGCSPLTGPGLMGNCACFILYMFDLACQIFLYLFGGHTNGGWWIEISLWSTFGGSWTHVGTLGYYWVRGLEGLQFKVLRSKYEYVVHFCPPSIVSEQRQPAYAKRAWCIFESYVLSSAPRNHGNYRSVHSRLVDSSRWMFNKIWCCSNQTCFLFSSMMAIFTSKVCIEQQLPMTIILPSSAESFFKETVESGGWLVRFSLIVDLLLCWYPAC